MVADKDIEKDKRQRDYTYTEQEVQHNLDGKGKVKSTETKTYEIMEVYGEQIQRLIEKDGKSLSEKDAAKEEAKIQKAIDKRKNESEGDRRKREQKQEKDREEGRKFVREVAEAYNFKLVGTESVGGREVWVIDGEPRPGFVPHMKEGKFLSKFHGRVWVDKSDLQLAKMDVECLDTVTWGLFLARFHKGSRFTLEQTRVNDEVWLPRQLAAKIDVRLALLKNFNVDLWSKVSATTRSSGRPPELSGSGRCSLRNSGLPEQCQHFWRNVPVRTFCTYRSVLTTGTLFIPFSHIRKTSTACTVFYRECRNVGTGMLRYRDSGTLTSGSSSVSI